MTNPADHWIQTATGLAAEPFDLKLEQISILDICHALSHACRYTGHTSHLYTVGMHSVAVARAVKAKGGNTSQQLWGLLHDGGEAYMSDIAQPLKCHPIFDGYRALEKEIDKRLRAKFCIDHMTDDDLKLVKTVDIAMLDPERKYLLTKEPKPWSEWPTFKEAENAFMEIIQETMFIPALTRAVFMKTFQSLT